MNLWIFLKISWNLLVKSFGRLPWEELKVLECSKCWSAQSAGVLKVHKGLVGILRLRAAHYAVALRLRVLEYSKCKSSAAGGGIDYLPCCSQSRCHHCPACTASRHQHQQTTQTLAAQSGLRKVKVEILGSILAFLAD